MTKHVRIENADAGSGRLVVEVLRRVEGAQSVPVNKHALDHPCQMIDLYVTPETEIVIRERKPQDAPPLTGITA